MEVDMADIKPTVWSALTIFLIVIITVPLAKFLMIRFPIPGLKDLIAAT